MQAAARSLHLFQVLEIDQRICRYLCAFYGEAAGEAAGEAGHVHVDKRVTQRLEPTRRPYKGRRVGSWPSQL